MMTPGQTTFPIFIFVHAADAGSGRLGYLFYNSFGRRRDYLRARQLREIDEIVRGLQSDAAAGVLPPIKTGWGGGVGLTPASAVDTNDDQVMVEWCVRACMIDVRLDADEPILADDERALP
jgi:hypothetical protein